MSDSVQNIPLDSAGRISIEITDGDLVVSWDEAIQEIVIEGGQLDVQRAADELFIHGEVSKRRRRSSPLEVSTDSKKYKVAFGGGQIEHDRETNETSLRWDFLRGLGGKDRASNESNSITLPVAIAVSKIEVKDGDLRLNAPAGIVDVEVKSGDFYSNGGTAKLTVSSGSGKSLIEHLEGDLTSMSGSGDVRITGTRGLLEVKAGSGEITLLDAAAPTVDLMAGAGNIEVRQVSARDFTCKTGSGDVTLIGGHLDAFEIRCGSGDVESRTIFGPRPQSIVTGSGDITLGIPRDLPMRVEAYTLGGDINSDIQLVTVGQRGPRSERTRRQVGSVGSGEPRADVNVRTSSGDIRLQWLSARTGPASSAPSPPPPPDVIPVPAASVTGDVGESGNAQMGILDALARGEISVDEADALLSQLESSNR